MNIDELINDIACYEYCCNPQNEQIKQLIRDVLDKVMVPEIPKPTNPTYEFTAGAIAFNDYVRNAKIRREKLGL